MITMPPLLFSLTPPLQQQQQAGCARITVYPKVNVGNKQTKYGDYNINDTMMSNAHKTIILL